MSVKITVGGGASPTTQVIPNAKEINARISTVLKGVLTAGRTVTFYAMGSDKPYSTGGIRRGFISNGRAYVPNISFADGYYSPKDAPGFMIPVLTMDAVYNQTQGVMSSTTAHMVSFYSHIRSGNGVEGTEVWVTLKANDSGKVTLVNVDKSVYAGPGGSSTATGESNHYDSDDCFLLNQGVRYL